MTRKWLSYALAFAALSFSAAAAHAQMPEDNAAWTARCAMLNSLATQIDGGHVPASLAAGTHGVPSIEFATFGFDRSRASEHNVACTMFFMAAIAERNGNGAAANPKTAHNLLVVAQSEVALAHKVKVTTLQHMKRGEEEAKQVKAKSLTADQSSAVLAAADTLPLQAPSR